MTTTLEPPRRSRKEALAIIESLGLTPVINAAGSPSRLGSSTPAAPVRAAMDAVSQHFVPVAEMQEWASAAIAEATGGEAGCVASGGDACLFLAAAACITGDDPAAIDRLPDTTGLRNEIVVHRAHRISFDHALRATGAQFVEFGYLGAPSGTGAYRWQLEAAITERTAAVFYVGQRTASVLPLDVVIEVAHARGVPVIVDGAGTLPPPENLRVFIALGADLVAFSGGKLISGPGASGFLAGRRDLVRAATLQQQDMYVHPDLWSAPLGRPDGREPLTEPAHQGIGRTMKVGREEIAGLVVALRAYAVRDHEADQRRWLTVCQAVADGLGSVVASTMILIPPEVSMPQVVIRLFDRTDARRVAAELQSGNPRVFLATMRLGAGELVVIPQNVRDEEVEPLVRRLQEAIGSLG